MPPVHLLILTICSGIILYAVSNVYNGHCCIECGGRRKHRRGCPLRRDGE